MTSIWPLLPVIDVITGAGANGVTAVVTALAVPVPATLTADTVKQYGTPFDSPVTVVVREVETPSLKVVYGPPLVVAYLMT